MIALLWAALGIAAYVTLGAIWVYWPLLPRKPK